MRAAGVGACSVQMAGGLRVFISAKPNKYLIFAKSSSS